MRQDSILTDTATCSVILEESVGRRMESKEAIADIQAHRAGESFKLEAIVTNKINPSRPSIAALSSKRYLLA